MRALPFCTLTFCAAASVMSRTGKITRTNFFVDFMFLTLYSCETTKFQKEYNGIAIVNKVNNILITGGTGLIGTRLTELLLLHGHRVSHLSRTSRQGEVPSFIWNIDQNHIDPKALVGIDTIVHLAGAGIADEPWTEDRKREILESRTNSTRLLLNVLKKTSHSVQTVVAASAIGYYGFEDHQEAFTEDSATW